MDRQQRTRNLNSSAPKAVTRIFRAALGITPSALRSEVQGGDLARSRSCASQDP